MLSQLYYIILMFFLKDEFEYFIYYLKQKIRQATKLNGFFAISIVSML